MKKENYFWFDCKSIFPQVYNQIGKKTIFFLQKRNDQISSFLSMLDEGWEGIGWNFLIAT